MLLITWEFKQKTNRANWSCLTPYKHFVLSITKSKQTQKTMQKEFKVHCVFSYFLRNAISLLLRQTNVTANKVNKYAQKI